MASGGLSGALGGPHGLRRRGDRGIPLASRSHLRFHSGRAQAGVARRAHRSRADGSDEPCDDDRRTAGPCLPWLVQMGWHRAGWYTTCWVDLLLFPANLPSANRIVPELQDIEIGTFIPDGPPETECGLFVEVLEPESALVLHSNSHLPLAWRQNHRADLDWSWAFVLMPVDGGGRTRFLFRSRRATSPRWLKSGANLAVVPCGVRDVP